MAADGDRYDDDFEPDSDDDPHAPWQNARESDITLGEQLGGGGFAVVYKGTYKGAKVAVKMVVDPSITPEQQHEFMCELQSMASVSGHPNIVKVIAARARPPKACIILELCGRSLFAILHGDPAAGTDTRPALSMETRLAYAIDAARAIAHLHARKPTAVIHRDIKSPNLLLGTDGKLKLGDFGLVATPHTTAGTPAYMAPELLADRPFNKSVDTYAFGVLLWEIFARQIPFAGWRPADISAAVQAGTRPDMAKLPASTPDVITELIPLCWHATPSRRPDMADVLTKLETWRPSATAMLEAGASRGGARAAAAPMMDALDMLAASSKPRAATAAGGRK